MKIMYTDTYANMSRRAANIISAQIILHPKTVLGLPTGTTPIGAYRQLIEWYKKGDLDFSQVTTFNLDEYLGLDGSHPQSYRYFMDNQLFDHVNIRKGNTHVPDGTAADPEAECELYEQAIKEAGGIDLQVLGIGNNGHIGFNEPGTAYEKTTNVTELTESTIEANSRLFASKEEVPTKALTMGMKTIMHARRILLLVSGQHKLDILNAALHGPITPEVPASLLQLHPDLTVIVSTEDIPADF
ncbi:MAG: glucosamine-6-phosphate deaminase [Clostridia bacterium]|nr:glucosamine-6-phosphate deaminase [Clostridia bacterium]